MNPKDEILEMIKGCRPKKRRSVTMIARRPELATLIAEFLDMKARGETDLTVDWFYQDKLRPEYGGPKHTRSVYDWIRDELQRDPFTGKPLDEA